jgi:hypothetical protein
MALENSEDAVARMMLNNLSGTGQFSCHTASLDILSSSSLQNPKEIWLWGVPLAATINSAGRDQFVKVSDFLRKSRQSRSEPSIMLDFGVDDVILIRS